MAGLAALLRWVCGAAMFFCVAGNLPAGKVHMFARFSTATMAYEIAAPGVVRQESLADSSRFVEFTYVSLAVEFCGRGAFVDFTFDNGGWHSTDIIVKGTLPVASVGECDHVTPYKG